MVHINDIRSYICERPPEDDVAEFKRQVVLLVEHSWSVRRFFTGVPQHLIEASIGLMSISEIEAKIKPIYCTYKNKHCIIVVADKHTTPPTGITPLDGPLTAVELKTALPEMYEKVTL